MIQQYGVIPYRRESGGALSVLLITSRETRRRVIPRGNPIAGLSPAQAAVREAYEEAGIEGRCDEGPLGTYAYGKRRKSGEVVPAEVTVFAFEVLLEHEDWPERQERERRWFPADEAAAAVDEAGLSLLVTKLKDWAPAR